MSLPNRPTPNLNPEAIMVCSPEDPKDYRGFVSFGPSFTITSLEDPQIDSPLVISNAGSYLSSDTLSQILAYLKIYPSINSVAVVVNRQDHMIEMIHNSLTKGTRPELFADQIDDIIRSWYQQGAKEQTLTQFSKDDIAVALSELMVIRLAHQLRLRNHGPIAAEQGLKDVGDNTRLDRVLVTGLVSDNRFSKLSQTVPMTSAATYSDSILRASSPPTR